MHEGAGGEGGEDIMAGGGGDVEIHEGVTIMSLCTNLLQLPSSNLVRISRLVGGDLAAGTWGHRSLPLPFKPIKIVLI
jgi:hypothetical protein